MHIVLELGVGKIRVIVQIYDQPFTIFHKSELTFKIRRLTSRWRNFVYFTRTLFVAALDMTLLALSAFSSFERMGRLNSNYHRMHATHLTEKDGFG